MTESTKTAIITAVLTGVFTIVAGIATYWFTTKEPELSYSVIGGPALSNALGSKRIFVVEVRNTGRKEVTQTFVQISVKNGELSELTSEASVGVKLVQEKTPQVAELKADLMNPDDALKVSFLASMQSAGSEPTVVVRAPGVSAVAAQSTLDSRLSLDSAKTLPFVIVPALAAVLSTFLFSSRSRLVQRIAPSSSGLHQSELSAYICGACGLFTEADQIRFGGSEISYRGVADFLHRRAKQAPNVERNRYVTAIRALLLVSRIAESSRKTIRSIGDSLASAALTDTEFEALIATSIDEGADPIGWRQRINAFVLANGIT